MINNITSDGIRQAALLKLQQSEQLKAQGQRLHEEAMQQLSAAQSLTMAKSPTAAEPASSPSSVLNPGPVEKPSESSSAMPVAPTVSLQEGREQLVLTVATGDFTRSIWCTWPEWEAIRIFCSTQPSMSEWLTQSGQTRDGAPGVAAPSWPSIRDEG